MIDELHRWCLQCDLEVRPLNPRGPRPDLDSYVDDLITRAAAGEAKRVSQNESRVSRISEAQRIILPSGDPALAFVVTLGNRRGAAPGFIHFDNGAARTADREPGEVKGASAHCVLRLVADHGHVGRYRLIAEDVRGLGRTEITQLLQKVFRAISEDHDETFVDPESGRRMVHRPVAHVHPRQSNEMRQALAGRASLPVMLLDTSAKPAFDEHPDYAVSQHVLRVRVKPQGGRTMEEALQALAQLGAANDYDRMRVSWQPSAGAPASTAEMRTDLADVGTALFAQREEVVLDQPLDECTVRLNPVFVDRIAAKF